VQGIIVTRPRHKDKDVEAAIRHAETRGWTVSQGGGGHAWGRLRCPMNAEECRCGEFCQISISSTPQNPGTHARKLRRLVDSCIYDKIGDV
jgi:hypothetical protein